MDLYFCRYNNYFNRIYKPKLAALSDYLTYKVGEVLNCNLWNPNDGVDAEQVLNYLGDIPDYLAVGDKTADTIDSIWFVIDAKRLRNGQYRMLLRRDLVAEHFNEIMNAPAYVEKGWADGDDSVVFNPENISVNQIKKRQDLLYDKSGCPWVVGFVKNDAQPTDVTVKLQFGASVKPDLEVDYVEDLPIFRGEKFTSDPSRTYHWRMWKEGNFGQSWQGCTVPNCVGYVNGVWMDYGNYMQTGGSQTFPFDFAGNANTFYTLANTVMRYVTESAETIIESPAFIEPGDVICFGGGPDGDGHVAIVEFIDRAAADPYIITSNSAYGGAMYYKQTLYFENNLTWSPSYYCQGIIKKPAALTFKPYDFSDISAFSTYVQSNIWRQRYFTNNQYTVQGLAGLSKCIVIDEDPTIPGDGYYEYICTLPDTATSYSDYSSRILTHDSSRSQYSTKGIQLLENQGYVDGEEETAKIMLGGVSYFNSIKESTTRDSDLLSYYIATYNNKVVKERITGKLYRITYGIEETVTDKSIAITQINDNGKLQRLFQAMTSYMGDAVSQGYVSGFPNEYTFYMDQTYNVYGGSITEIQDTYIAETSIEPYSLKDAPYTMFFFPLGELPVYRNSSSDYKYTMTKELSLMLARAISEKLSSNLMDLVVMPYCPVLGQIRLDAQDNPYLLDGILAKSDVIPINSSTVIASVYYAEVSDFEFYIDYATNISKDDYKVEDICTKYRVSGSNNSGYFEFSPAKNHNITKLWAHCTYKPFQPYVRIEPDFKYLYGGQYKDGRGLILSGDFSLPRTEDAWNNYLIQNKYYKDIFDRGTENMETNRNLERWEMAANGVVNTANAAVMGGMTMGPYGAIGGAVAGFAGAAADAVLSEKRYEEAKDYRQDLFTLNNKTIQALPDNLVKGNGWNIDSTYVPFVEFYECTTEERAAVVNKLRWNGYSINRIGTFNDYAKPNTETYLKGQIIRLTTVSDDFHYNNEISNEMYKGIFITVTI